MQQTRLQRSPPAAPHLSLPLRPLHLSALRSCDASHPTAPARKSLATSSSMSADVALESPAQLQLDSPPSSPSQASDTAAADERIFFGPIQSPEKKYAAPSGAPRFQTPIRRSARFSAAMVPLPLFPEEDPSGPSDTREGTPEDLAPDGMWSRYSMLISCMNFLHRAVHHSRE